MQWFSKATGEANSTDECRPDPGSVSVALMLKVHDDDKDAFSRLYHVHYKRVVSFFYSLCRNAHTANDLTQETFLRIWKFRQRYAATGSFPSYLFSFARIVWLEQCRAQKRGKNEGPLQFAPPVGPDTYAGQSEAKEIIFEALEKLPPEQRMVIVLRDIEGLSPKEVASVMGCSVNTVRSRKILAMEKLRKALKGVATI